MEDLANFVRASIRPIGVIIILAASVQMMIEGRTPPGWFIPFIIFAAEWFVERPIIHAKKNFAKWEERR